jgi:hypothetical protein
MHKKNKNQIKKIMLEKNKEKYNNKNNKLRK